MERAAAGPPCSAVGPVLDADPRAIPRVERGGNVAGGVDVGVVGAQRGVDADTVVDG
jgi:hypothetical protein